MARTRQTARKSTGGKAPRKSKALRKKATDVDDDDDVCDDFEEDEEDCDYQSNLTNLSIYNNAAGAPVSTVVAQKATKFVKSVAEHLNDLVDVNYVIENAFYAHFFECGASTTADSTFTPYFALANSPNPLAPNTTDYWIGVNFNSKYDGEGIRNFGRPPLNLVVALDISGSMGCNFDNDSDQTTKLKVAKDCLIILLSQLQPEDSFGLVLFNEQATVIQPLTKWKDSDKVALEKKISKFRSNGGTEVTVGISEATKLLSKTEEGSTNRVFVVTDMEVDKRDGDSFINFVSKNSDESIWTTVIGVGLDLSADVIERVSKTAGANYSNVRTTSGFKELMDKEFGYIVTPLAFNISLTLQSNNFQVEKGYGTPEINNMKPGNYIKLSTEFPGLLNEKLEKKPGPFVFKLNKLNNESSQFILKTQFDDLQGITQNIEQSLEFKENYSNCGIRKALLLIYYSDLMKEYIHFWENGGKSSVNYKEKIKKFIDHFTNEMIAVGDSTLQQELDVLNIALTYAPDPIPETPAENTHTTTTSNPDPNNDKRKPESLPEDLEISEKKQKVDDDSTNCVVCLTNSKSVLLLPCKHVCCCGDCSRKVNDCPLCRTVITDRTNVFL